MLKSIAILFYLLVVALMIDAWRENLDVYVDNKSSKRFYSVMKVVFLITNFLYLLIEIKNPVLGKTGTFYFLFGLAIFVCITDRIIQKIKIKFCNRAIVIGFLHWVLGIFYWTIILSSCVYGIFDIFKNMTK